MMPYEVGKTFIIRVPLLSIETYKELCSEKDGLPVIKTKETLTGYTHKLFTLRRKKGTDQLDPISCAHTEAKEWAQVELVRSTAALRYEPCTQFINVSQKALHIYFIDGCRVCPLDARYKNRTK